MRSLQRASTTAQRLLRVEQIKTIPIPVERIARKRATIVRRSLGDDISGMLVPVNGSWAIVVNSDHSEARQRFTIAHELGHLLLHRYTTTHADRQYKVRFRDADSSKGNVAEEIEANRFAAALLMPRELLVKKLVHIGFEYDPNDEEAAQLDEVAHAFRVSKRALTIRMATLQLF